MDVRLHDVVTGLHRARRLTQSDLPLVARSLTAVIRRRGGATSCLNRHSRAVELILGSGEKVVILKEDWEKIWPFIEDGTFNPQVIPTSPRGIVPRFPNSIPEQLDWRASGLYQLILNTLTPLFPEIPTSDL